MTSVGSDRLAVRSADGPALREEFVAAGLLLRTSVDGVYLRSAGFEAIARGVEALVHRAGTADDVPASEPLLYLPPVMPRAWFVQTDYLRSFPDLLGSIHSFHGSDAEHAELLAAVERGEDWTAALEPTDVVLSSAACHSVYPSLAGTLPAGGRRLEVQGTCFRHEPSPDPWRMQSFRMHEFVRIGTPQDALEHRDQWLTRALSLLAGLGLDVVHEVAHDPFFGRVGRMLARSQRAAELKYEITCPVTTGGHRIAVTSANCHHDHFGTPFGIRSADGEVAHTACVGFGLERLAIALLAVHGTDVAAWPVEVRTQLALETP